MVPTKKVAEALVQQRGDNIMNKLTVSILILSLLLLLQPESRAVQIQDLLGVNGSPNDHNLEKFHIKWVRADFSWKNVEKKKGVYDWEKYDKMISLAQKKGFTLLPIVGYTPIWGGDGSQSSPPADVKKWTDFINAMVNRYSKPPFNIQYYQIWNEPTRKAGFWKGTDEQFINLIYLPAAKIIRNNGGKVVFGGWPISNNIKQLLKILNTSKAYKYTDIIAFHYRSSKAYDAVYDNFVKSGPVTGIWQTEIGYTDKPYFLLTEYSKILSWVIEHNWNESDQYKIFWYPFFSNRKNYKKAIYAKINNNEFVTSNGKQLSLFLDIYSGGNLYPLKHWSTNSNPEDHSFAINVKGKKIIYTIFMNNKKIIDKNTYYVLTNKIKVKNAMGYCSNGTKAKYTRYNQVAGHIALQFENDELNNICGDNPVYYVILNY